MGVEWEVGAVKKDGRGKGAAAGQVFRRPLKQGAKRLPEILRAAGQRLRGTENGTRCSGQTF